VHDETSVVAVDKWNNNQNMKIIILMTKISSDRW
jgi:hypothetical protein